MNQNLVNVLAQEFFNAGLDTTLNSISSIIDAATTQYRAQLERRIAYCQARNAEIPDLTTKLNQLPPVTDPVTPSV